MVKGVSRQVIVVRPPDTKLFEQAIFLLRDGADGGISDEALLRQARQAAGQYLQASRTPRRRIRLQNLAWALAGAAATGLAWLLSIL